LPEIVEPGTVTGAVPTALILVPLHLASKMGASKFYRMDASVIFLVNAHLFPMKKYHATMAIGQMLHLLTGDLE